MRFSLPIPADSVIRIKVPDEISISDNSGTQTYLNTISNGRTSLKFEKTGQSIVITDAVPSYKEAGSFLNLEFSKVQTPISSAETSSFEIQIDRKVGTQTYAIEGISEGVTLRTEPQELTDFDFRSDNMNVF